MLSKFQLYKLDGFKSDEQNRKERTPGRFGQEAAKVMDKREQRKLDQAAGLVPFAVKLNGDLIKELHATAEKRQITLAELVTELLQKGLV
ncbi:hypothetical protein [Iodobacter fluviatilis]|jgi:hypothetical protein|uniref:LexA regulated protein n=1 Tax=Iodobacter fluviatilis TaxID=537 RepID=A0A7G3G4T7_9NEIS|nr:hypothetical protein [Iodobacter fluviatilis]QBC42152.1 hypothetical protein C1H71_00315 [Iodobacter fluviatilis]